MPLVLFVISWIFLHWSACYMLWRPLQGDLPTWPALALVQLGRQRCQQNVSLKLSCLLYGLLLHGLQVRQPLFSLRRCWRRWGRANILGALQLWLGTILLFCRHGRLRWSPCCRGILSFWSGCHWCYTASWLPTKLHAKLCWTPSEVHEDMVKALLVLQVFLTQYSKIEKLLSCAAPSCYEACLFFFDDLLSLFNSM